MENKYEKSKIYAIKSPQTNKYYIGSTYNSLSVRLSKHKNHYKSFLNKKYNFITSFEILKYNDYYIELVADYPCLTKRELIKKEGEIIKENLSNLVNKKIDGLTRKESNLKYRLNNRTKIQEINKRYRLKNILKLKEKIICPCGNDYTKCNKTNHLKTKKHNLFINSQMNI
jgi:hypothetical protein